MVWLFVICAVVSYLIAGINPAIVLSKIIYKEDIRTKGSGNPGFTNFKRVYGGKYAWLVMFLDMFKSALLSLVFGLLFHYLFNMWQIGVAFTGLFAMIGHCYPIWYKFKGGKAFLVGAANIWFVDWRVALIAMIVMIILLLSTKYMSLAVLVSNILYIVFLIVFQTNWWVVLLNGLSVLLLVLRHIPNIKKLLNGTESKFYLRNKKE